MEIKDLKNYGRPLTEMGQSMSEELGKEISELSNKIIGKHLNTDNLNRLASSLETEKQRMLKHDLSTVREKGLKDEEFIKHQIGFAAFFSVISKIMGREKTLEIFSEMAENTGLKMLIAFFPTLEDMGSFDDPFITFKEWFSAMADANKKIGAHDFELIENTHNAIQINFSYCAWHEISEQLGVKEACLTSCYSDDVFLPGYCQKIGAIYKRTNTLAKGADFCDFRFERQMKIRQ